MNKKFFAYILSLFFVSICSSPCSLAEDRITRPYDWTVEIETQELKRQFDYTGSHFRPIVKDSIIFYSIADDENKKAYEDIWYHDGKPCGLERINKFTITPGDGIAIKVKHKSDTASHGEYKAAANAILRIVLDAYLNHNAVAIVNLPPASYTSIINELRNQNAVDAPPHDADHPLDSVVNIFLQSGTDGPSQTLYFM